MQGNLDAPKVFISYSWSSPEHKAWVVQLAGRLQLDGVRVVIDDWDLKEGQDLYHFMEQMVKDEEISKVLVISDQHYQKKADEKKGGVGTESQLISKQVYENVKQEKFIPVVREKDMNGKPCLPIFMQSRIYFDFSKDDGFEIEYEKLLRNIYGKPESRRPPLGVAPSFILEDEPIPLRTAHKTKQLKALIDQNANVNVFIADYFSEFKKNLEDLRIAQITNDIDDVVIAKLEQSLSLRDDFIEFVNTLVLSRKVNIQECFSEFFDMLVLFQYKPEDITSWNEMQFDHYRFLNYEFFLYFLAILLKHNALNDFSYFTKRSYFFHYNGELRHSSFVIFNSFITSLDDYRNNRLQLRRVSITADLIKERAKNPLINFQNLLDTDILLHYLSFLGDNKTLFGRERWFPRCAVYNQRYRRLEIIQKMISKEHCEKIKDVLGAKNTEEVKDILKKIQGIQTEEYQKGGYRRFDYEIPAISEIIKIETIGTIN